MLIMGAPQGDPAGILLILVTENVFKNVSQEVSRSYLLPVFENFGKSCAF